jgi:hypothetical protein
MASDDAEGTVYRAAKDALSRWLGAARDAVLAPWRKFKSQPNPGALASADGVWAQGVDRIVAALTPALREGWQAAHLDRPFDMRDPYIQTNVALAKNLLVRVPDETHSLVVKAILEGTNKGEDNARIAQRVEDILTYTGSENWDGRARLIAQTETNRHYNSSLLAHALLAQRQDGGFFYKTWETRTDGRERQAHLFADHQPRPLAQPYLVDRELMMFPGDPMGSASNVCNCRCGQLIHKGAV